MTSVLSANSVNVANLNVNSLTGAVSFSGLASGIDWQSIVNEIMAADQAPIDTLTQQVTTNQAKISALQTLNTDATGLQNAISTLYGQVSFNNTGNVFAAKTVSESSSRTDGLTPTAASSLVTATVSNSAAVGSHSIEIRSVATSEKIAGGTFASATTALGFSGSFTIAGANTATITVNSNNTLQDVATQINNANTGTNATGISATVIQVSATQNVLVLTNTQMGQTITLGNETGGVLNSLGLSADGGTTFSNELQVAQPAELTVDGLLDPTHYESSAFTNAATSAPLSSILPSTTFPGSFTITVGSSNVTVNYAGTDTLQTLVSNINTAITNAGAGNSVFDSGVSAAIVTNSTGSRLQITDTNGSPITLGDTNGLMSAIGMNDDLIVQRNTNTITDLFPGVTLNLLQAEDGTTVNLQIGQNATQIQTAITGFVTAYNTLRTFTNQQMQIDPTTGQAASTAGPLFGDSALESVQQILAQIVGSGVSGVNPAFSTLAQIGISLASPSSVSDPTQAYTLQVDTSTLQSALTNNLPDVQNLFTFAFTSSNPQASILSFNGSTSYNSSGYTLNITSDGTQITGANINGVPNSVTINGQNSHGNQRDRRERTSGLL